MTASIGLPTPRLIRVAIDLLDGKSPLDLADLANGEWRRANSTESERLDPILRHAHSSGAKPLKQRHLTHFKMTDSVKAVSIVHKY